MTTGEYIRKLRKEHDLTQEELGKMLSPPVNRAAVQKWESGKVKTIRKEYIEEMARIFDIRPAELMCFDKEQLLSDESRTIDQIQDQYGSQAVQLLEYFNKLNQMGKDRMLENAEDISAIDKYSKDG
jgi:transcriptional regulator with XRE-family HTH domain